MPITQIKTEDLACVLLCVPPRRPGPPLSAVRRPEVRAPSRVWVQSPPLSSFHPPQRRLRPRSPYRKLSGPLLTPFFAFRQSFVSCQFRGYLGQRRRHHVQAACLSQEPGPLSKPPHGALNSSPAATKDESQPQGWYSGRFCAMAPDEVPAEMMRACEKLLF